MRKNNPPPPGADRVPPQDLDAEKALLGSMLMGESGQPWTLDELATIVGGPEAFYVPDHSLIFRVIVAAHAKDEPIELFSIVPALNAAQPRAEREWERYAIELAESFSNAASAEYYARRVRDCWQLREMIRLCSQTMDAAYGALAEPDGVCTDLTQGLERIERVRAVDREPERESELLTRLENPASNVTHKVHCGLGWLETNLDGGFDRGSLTVVGARPSCGKTSLGLGMSIDATQGSAGVSALFVSAEMSAEQIGQRLLCMRAGIAMHDLRSGKVPDLHFASERNQAALAASEAAGIWIVDGVTEVRAICALARSMVRRHTVGLVTVDYLQLLDLAGHHENRNLEVGAMVKMFKRLAVTTEAAVVILSQLTRASDNQDRKPRLSDLRDSGEIEAHVDNAILIHKGKDTHEELAPTTLIIAKHRQGNTGIAEVVYRKSTMSYEIRGAPEPIREPVAAAAGGDDAVPF